MRLTAIRDKADHKILTCLELHSYETNENLPITLFAELVGANVAVCNRLSQASEITGDNIKSEEFIDKLCEELQKHKKDIKHISL